MGGKMEMPMHAAQAGEGGERSVAEDFYGLGEVVAGEGEGEGEGGRAKGKAKINLSTLFHKLVADANPNVRRELCKLCGDIMVIRCERYGDCATGGGGGASAYVTSKGELELPLLLLLLSGDDIKEVQQDAYSALKRGCNAWAPHASPSVQIAQKTVFGFQHNPQ